MQFASIRLSLLSIALAAAALPALAGNYAEGDPRPQARSSNVASSAVAAEARAFTLSAPVGYPQGESRATVTVNKNSRDAVKADTLAWVQSGMANFYVGDAVVDVSHPSYIRAARTYASMRANTGTQSTQAPATGAPIAR